MSAMNTNNAQPKILIVDDNPDKVLALEVVLEDLDNKIVRANSGREALRQVLNNEFAVILLDVNMPDMDGFETAAMIRKRKSSSQTPIIFITSFGDEMHAARGYSLGAVDYILAPVLPDVLRTKVMVFVELFRKTQQLLEQADALRRRAAQQQRLAATALAINEDAGSIESTLKTLVDAACGIVGANIGVAMINADARVKAGHRANDPIQVVGFGDPAQKELGTCVPVLSRIAQFESDRVGRAVAVLPHETLLQRCATDSIESAAISGLVGGLIVAPLTGRDGRPLGMLYLASAKGTVFSHDDEALLIQLAQLGAITVENIIFTRDRDANRLKDEFLATLSHELRTPLSAILGWSELLKRRHTPADIDRGLEVIQRSVRSQMKLIEDLLDVSRINNGKLKVQMKDVRLQQIVTASVESIKPTADARNISVDTVFQDAHDEIFGDPDRLHQVICNLLGNAVKFSPANSRIGVTVNRRGHNVSVKVEDHGMGIDPAFLPHVFDRFRQADSSSTRSHGGLGIGLAIVRHIVEIHGGTVVAHSEGHGKGATFTIELPLRENIDPMRTSNDHGRLHPSVSEGSSLLEGMEVLVVEDVADTRDMLCAMLKEAGAVVSEAGSVAEAMALFSTGVPDVLISDIGMPGESGLELIRKIRELPPQKGGFVPAIALTAYVREDDRLRALSAGFQHHLPKPVEFAQLVRLISSYSDQTLQLNVNK
jgi:signal transduction histidine kinase/DNA-binding response OmpR family regulator